MKTLIAGGLLIVLAVSLSLLLRARPVKKSAAAPRPDVYYGLRAQMLQGTRSKFSLPATSTPTKPWGVVMDWGLAQASATVVALSDGTASVYLSSGGGYLGGGPSHESMRQAAQKAVTIAAGVQMQAVATKSYPLPHSGEVIFYLLTDAGVFTVSGSQAELSNGQHPFSTLASAMQEIITEYRRIQQPHVN